MERIRPMASTPDPISPTAVALTAVGWILSNVIVYMIGRRTRVDEIKIKRKFDLAEQLAVALQKDHNSREDFMDWFKANLGHLDLMEALAAFDQHAGVLYKNTDAKFEALQNTRAEIGKLNMDAVIYFDKSFHEMVNKYMHATEFSYTHDGVGGIIFNNYARAFFSNLLDADKIEVRRESFEEIIDRLRRMKH